MKINKKKMNNKKHRKKFKFQVTSHNIIVNKLNNKNNSSSTKLVKVKNSNWSKIGVTTSKNNSLKDKPALCDFVYNTTLCCSKNNLKKSVNIESSKLNNRVDNKSNLVLQQKNNLPIFKYKKELLKYIKQHNTVILIGETACGKTTQIPQYLHEDGITKSGILGITQPRRVAAITIAQRVADEINCRVGETVGYFVRFEDITSPSTKIKYLTDGMLLREAILDPLLSRYRVVILDEAHERTIHTDILFGIVKEAQSARKKLSLPLKVIVMSATMNVDHFSNYFNNCPVFYLQGRQYPIQIMYPMKPQHDYVFSALVTAFQIHQKEPEGDILIFCTGQEEIESMVKSVKETSLLLPIGSYNIISCPLYAALPNSKQMKAFESTPKGHRKFIFSTNIAETSVTIRGVKYVIDTGMVKARTYHPGTGLDLLKVQRISKAQAWQRAGRAGRESNGFCYRLFTMEEYEKMVDHALPEIKRCNLSSAILQILAIGIENVREFDFMDKPSKENIQSALDQLHMLGAIDSNQNSKTMLTDIGKKMATFPLDPKFAKVLLMSRDFQCTDEVVSIVSMLSIESIIHIPSSKKNLAKSVLRKFESNEGDHIMLLNIYKGYKSSKESKEWCLENFINYRNMKVIMQIRKQISELCTKAGILPKSSGKDYSNIRKCFVYGFFMNVAELQQGDEYLTIDRRQKVVTHPSSCIFKSKPGYLIFNELVQTSKCFMRNVMCVDPEWLKEAAPQYFNRKRVSAKT